MNSWRERRGGGGGGGGVVELACIATTCTLSIVMLVSIYLAHSFQSRVDLCNWIDNFNSNSQGKCNDNWRAIETFSGVTQLKIGDICLFICMCGHTYVILYFDPRVFLCSLRVQPRPQASLNRILWFSNHYPYHLRN